jgi:cytochrome c oxidase subunit 2
MVRKLGVFAAVAITFGVACATPAWSDFQLNMPVGVTTSSREIYHLHMLILWVCVLIGLGVYGAMITAIIRFRKSAGAKAAKFTHNTTLEVVWTVIPALILVAMAVPSARTLVRLSDTRNSQLTIEVTGSQWQWNYNYLDEGVSFYSRLDRDSLVASQPGSGKDPYSIDHYLLNVNEPVVVPVDTKVRLLITAADVVHSWWMPDFGVKKDAIPGYVNEAWFLATEEGTYRGQCAELCGMGHGFMPIVVRVTSAEDYQNWLEEMRKEHASEAN